MANRVISAIRQMGPGLVVRGLILAAVLVAVGVLLDRFAFEEMLDAIQFSGGDDAGWLNGRLSYLALAAAFTAVGGPRQAVSFFAAYFFGLPGGFLLGLAGSALGCVMAFSFARLFHDAAARLVRGRAALARDIWARNAFSLTLILRLLPVGSNLIANLAAGATRIPLGPFLAGSVTGYIPQTAVFALMGSGVNVGSTAQVALSVGMLIVSTILGVWVYAHYRKRLRTDEPAR